MSVLEDAFWGAGWNEEDHPRDPGGEGGGQFVSRYTIKGTSDDHTDCDNCGRSDLKSTVALEDQEGNIRYCGSECASRLLGYGEGGLGEKKVRAEVKRLSDLTPGQRFLEEVTGVKQRRDRSKETEAWQKMGWTQDDYNRLYAKWLRENPSAFTSAGWDESEHPRWPKSDPHGGQFRPKGGAGTPDYDQIQDELNKLEDPIIANRMRRVAVKVGQAKNLREEMLSWYYRGGGWNENNDPEIVSIDENWGNWTQSELYRLRSELQKQLSEGEWKQKPGGEFGEREWTSDGLLSTKYAKEIGRSLSQARNEARRVLEAVDKALTIEQFGMDKAMELYPELFETKVKAKPVDPRSQGIPEVYLSEKGTFKPGFDAKLKSDLVNSYFDLNPQTQVSTVREPEGAAAAGLQRRMIDDWKARNPSRTQDSTGREWTNEEIWPVVKTDLVNLDPKLYDEYMSHRRVRRSVESTLLHRFEPGEAYRILEGRGWLDHLEKKKNVIGRPVIGEPNLDNRRSREILESVYSHSNSNEWTTTPPETTRGDGVSAIGINGFHLRPVQELVGSAAEIPNKIHKQLAAKGVQLYFGPPESTDLDEMWGIRDEKARNRDRRTMKQVAGFYSPSSRRVIISSDLRSGSADLATHEIGHAIGDVLGVDHHPELHLWHNKLKPKLGRYYLQNGNDFAGAQELWAEGVALHYHLERNKRLGREVMYRRSGPFKSADTLDTPDGNDYMRWVRKTLEELEEGRQMPQNR